MKTIKVRKKPIEVQALELTEDIWRVINQFGGYRKYSNRKLIAVEGLEKYFKIETLEGDMDAEIGDYMIIGIKGEIYPCRKDIFEETYEVSK